MSGGQDEARPLEGDQSGIDVIVVESTAERHRPEDPSHHGGLLKDSPLRLGEGIQARRQE